LKIKSYGLLACLAPLILFGGCVINLDNGVKGSGIVKTESRQAIGFSAISFETEGNLTVQQTGKESLSISADDNLLSLFESRVADRTLYLNTSKSSNINPSKPAEFVVQVKSLESLNMEGVGSIEVKDIEGTKLSVTHSGVGEVTITGSADVLDLNLSGVGSYQGEAFKTQQATVHSSGVGSAVINASEQLDATVSGVGSVEYIGSPQVQESVEGVGDVKKR
jgi:Putative auto-transporter adhesin, head GIN domain